MKKMKWVLLSTLLLTSGLFTSCNKNEMIMIVGVNSSEDFNEIGILVDALNYRNQEEIDGINFYTGKIANKNVVIAQTPVGTSEAAMTTTIGIKQFHPKYVISEGSSGGHHDAINVNDIVLGQDILDIASYKGDPENPSGWELQHPILHSNSKLLEIADKVDYDKGNKKCGTISSSDCWNTSEAFVNKLHAAFNDDCEEMESYAVTNVCKYYNVPSIAIRVISNNLTQGSEEGDPGAFDPEAGKNCQYYVMDVLNAI